MPRDTSPVQADSVTRLRRRAHRRKDPPVRLATRPGRTAPGLLQDGAFRSTLRGSIAVLAVLGAVYLIYLTWTVFQALLVAAVLATMLWPWVTRVTNLPVGRRRLPRALAVALIYLTAIGFTLGVIWLALSAFLPLADPLLATYPQQTAFLRSFLDPFRRGDIAGGAAKVVQGVTSGAAGQSQGGTAAPSPVDPGGLLLSLLGGLLNTALVLVFAFFLLLEGNRFAQWTLLLVPRQGRPRFRALGLRIRDRASQWVLATVIYSSLSAAILTAGLGLIGLPTPWLFGILGAAMALIPGLGVGLVAIPAAAVALTLSTWQAVAVVTFGLTLHVLDATIIAPKVFGNRLRLPTFIVFVAILLGSDLLGLWGAIVALPLAAGIQLAIQDAMGRPAEP